MTLTRFRWIPGPDDLAHAVALRRRTDRAACGLLIVDELPTTARLDRCERCLRLLGLPIEPDRSTT